MYWIAGGTNSEHHMENVDRAASGKYGKGFSEINTIVLPTGDHKSFDICALDSSKGNYLFDKRAMCKEAGVVKYVVYSKKDKEYEYVTVSKDYMIVYKYLKQVMIIYKLEK